MTYVYRAGASDSADALAKALKATRIRALDGITLGKGDVVVCWGAQLENVPAGVTVLNGPSLKRKFTDIRLLTKANVRTVQATEEKPKDLNDPVTAKLKDLENFIKASANGTRDVIKAVLPAIGVRVSAIKKELDKPWAGSTDWFGREDDHSRASDLITPPKKPDYWVKREEFVKEYRVHSFDGLSIRAGHKVIKAGFKNPSPWIRSWESGWDMDYSGVKPPVREIAAKAVKALGLTFGAVDIGETAKGELVVLEVNRAPALDGGEIPAYVRAFERWMRS